VTAPDAGSIPAPYAIAREGQVAQAQFCWRRLPTPKRQALWWLS